jgi:hypothetical protein
MTATVEPTETTEHRIDPWRDALEAEARVRAALVVALRDGFERFLERANGGDLYMMREVLLNHDGNTLGPKTDHMVLPYAFLQEISDEEEQEPGDASN